MNPLRKTFSLMTAGILTVVLTTAPVNADAAGRESAEERNRRAGIPACNAAGTAYISGREAVARVFGKPVSKDPDSLVQVCNDDGLLRIVQPPMGDASGLWTLEFEWRMFKTGRGIFCLIQYPETILRIETTPENEAANREQAALYAATIEASPQFQYVVNYVNKKHGKSTVPGYIVTLIWVGPKYTLDDKRWSNKRICGMDGGKLWDITAPRKQVAAAVNEFVEAYLWRLVVSDLITSEESEQLSLQLAKIPALDPSSP